MASAEVKRPTPTTGLVVSFFTNDTYGSCAPSSPKRAVTESLAQSLTFTSQRSGNSASISTISRPSVSLQMPSLPSSSSTANRNATPQTSPTASRVSSSSSRVRRTRFSRDPPYSSVRWLYRRLMKCIGNARSCPAYTYTISNPASRARRAALRCQRRTFAMSRRVMALACTGS